MAKKFIAEFIGTFVLVVFGCGSALNGMSTGMVALAFGLAVVAMAYSIGNISGCHINPAISLAMLIRKNISFKDFIAYVIAQCLGAIAGAGVLCVIFGRECGFGANMAAAQLNITVSQAFIIEVVLTFVFVLAAVGATAKAENSSVAGLIIGLSLTLVHILGIPLTGTSVNPARSLGPALFAGGVALNQLWVFIVAPFIGAAVAALVYTLIEKD